MAEPVEHRALRGRSRVLVATAVALATVGCVVAGGGKPPPPDPTPRQCSTVDFDKATVTQTAVTNSVPPSHSYRVTVSGTTPYLHMTVSLNLLEYIRQPEYWGIEVIACGSPIGLPALGSYTVTHDFTGPLGTCGIEVIGASRTQSFDLAGCAATLRGSSWVLDPASLAVPVPAGRPITASFSDTTMSGSAACNRYTASYKTGPGDAFSLGPIAATRMACEPVTSRAEATFFAALTDVTEFRLSRSELQLVAASGSVLRFTPAAASLR